MARAYTSKYTGSQIDEAVKAIIENNIQLEDFSPELVETIKGWTEQNSAKIVISSLENFPIPGDNSTLYLALNNKVLYLWDATNEQYVEFIKDGSQDIQQLDGGGANSW